MARLLRRFGTHVRRQFVGYLALFVALGGTAWAVAANSVGTAQLKDDAVTGAKVRNHSLTGVDLRKSKLGPVPRAHNAANLAGEPASAYRLHCSAGLQPTADICFETGLRGPTDWNAALETCRRAQRRLPSLTELAAVYNAIDAAQVGEWTSDTAAPSSGNSGGAVMSLSQSSARVLSRSWQADSGSQPYRCVTSPVN